MIYTNLDLDNMVEELEKKFKNVKNKDYIKDTIEIHYKYKMITEQEKEYLYKKYMEV